MDGHETRRIIDVLVIGGGPSGSTAARYLKQLCPDLQVMLIDRNSWPRDKPCAAGLTYKLFTTFPELREQDIFYGVTHAVTSCGTHYGKVTLTTDSKSKNFVTPHKGKITTNEKFIFAMSKRLDLDPALIQLAKDAGVDFLEDCEAKEISWLSQGNSYPFPVEKSEYLRAEVLIQGSPSQIDARCIILASGLMPGTLRARGKIWYPRQPYPPAATVCANFEMPLSEIIQFWGNELKVYMQWAVRGLPGYFWIFPKCDSVHAGIVLNHVPGVNLQDTFLKILKLLSIRNKIPSSMYIQAQQPKFLQGHPIPLNGIASHTTLERLLVTGDAGGFVSAMDGEGIYYAMLSGKLAAETIANLARTNENFCYSNLRQYQKKWQQLIAPTIRSSLCIQKLMWKMADPVLEACNNADINSLVKLVLIGEPRHHATVLVTLLILFAGYQVKKLMRKVYHNPIAIQWGNYLRNLVAVGKIVMSYVLNINQRF
ncbi:MAG TPA: NAD(P)/FAD-dependent oxidoreductase [Candidatus Lokiarchaeia archaeon]|nr:NAD(P)/FAD-dependent oxidoreductase [Candidatus Lokiarchaeia archaeon]